MGYPRSKGTEGFVRYLIFQRKERDRLETESLLTRSKISTAFIGARLVMFTPPIPAATQVLIE